MSIFHQATNLYYSSANFHRIINNILWLFFDKILRMGVGLFVGVWVARHLGPSQFGLWNYAIAFTSLFGAIATLGLDGILVRELSQATSHRDEILGSAFVLKFVAGSIMLVFSLAAISLIKPGDRLILSLVFLSATSFIFQSLSVIDSYFQSQTQSKYSVYAYNGAFIASAFIKLIFLFYKAHLLYFAIANVFEIGLSCVFLIGAYSHNHLNIRSWQFNKNVAIKLLHDSWPLIFAGLAISIYMRIDQVMIGEFLGSKEVGIYSAAVRVSEIWHFIPMAIANSTLPTLMEYRKKSNHMYMMRIQQLYNSMLLLAIFVAIIVTFGGDVIIHILYGNDFIGSSNILIILIWSGIATCLGVASSNWLMAENLQKFSFYRTAIGCVTNVLLNLLLIPNLGARGAAMATLISYFIATFFVIFWDKTRISGLMMLKSFCPFFFKSI